MIDRVIQLAIPTTDIARATPFFRDVLGLKLLFEAPDGLAFFDVGGVRLMIGPGTPAPDRSGQFIYFNTPDIQAFAKRLHEQGVTFEEEPHVVAQLPDRDVWL